MTLDCYLFSKCEIIKHILDTQSTPFVFEIFSSLSQCYPNWTISIKTSPFKRLHPHKKQTRLALSVHWNLKNKTSVGGEYGMLSAWNFPHWNRSLRDEGSLRWKFIRGDHVIDPGRNHPWYCSLKGCSLFSDRIARLGYEILGIK